MLGSIPGGSLDDRVEALAHGVVRLMQRGDLAEHLGLAVRLVLLAAPAPAGGPLPLAAVLLERRPLFVGQRRVRLARARALRGSLLARHGASSRSWIARIASQGSLDARPSLDNDQDGTGVLPVTARQSGRRRIKRSSRWRSFSGLLIARTPRIWPPAMSSAMTDVVDRKAGHNGREPGLRRFDGRASLAR